MKKNLLLLTLLLMSWSWLEAAHAAVTLTHCQGWFEAGYVTWTPLEGAADYHVYYKKAEAGESAFQKLDNALIRNYGTYGRADVVGLTPGDYCFKVVPVAETGEEISAEASVSETFTAVANDRSGYAHFNYQEGIGAYNNDGTLKKGAKVLYVHAGNAKTVSTEVITNKNGTKQTFTGLQAIINAYQKGLDSTPLAIRIIGTIRDSDMDTFGSSAEGLQIKGKNNTIPMNITLEGIGDDAAIWGFGILTRNALSVELRNFAVMLCMDDCISLDTDNSHIWVHHIDFFYGNAGGDSDQAKGDGSIDIKGDSQYITVSYCHFWDSGKCSLCGMKSESGPNWITYHHNWFDHSDSRHPRIRTMSVHIYNNYFDGNAKYGVGVTSGGNAFVENNYFRNCKYPMMISKQGSDNLDPDGNGTFSGEEGGMIKAFGNYMEGEKSFLPHTQTATNFDAYVAASREEQVPESYKSVSGNHTYTNFDTNAELFYTGYTLHNAELVPTILQSTYGAGRMNHGDFQWTFDNATEDANYSVIAALKTALQNYKTSLVGFYNDKTEPGGDTPGDDTPDPPVVVTGDSLTCVFTGMKPSNTTFFTINGNCSNSKGSATVDGVTYTECLKMESSTSIKFTTTRQATLKVVFASTETVSIKVNGVKTTTADASGKNILLMKDLAAGTYELTKADTRNVFYIGVFYTETGSSIENIDSDPAHGHVIYNLRGQRIAHPDRPGIYIIDGRKQWQR